MQQRKIAAEKTLFCFYYLTLGNAREAAAIAGIREDAAALLLCEDVAEELERVSALLKTQPSKAITGLERLAYGSVNDAAKLLYLDDDAAVSRLETLDLYNVSEIRRNKSGGVEIKFHDRQKALETLMEHAVWNGETNAAQSFCEALDRSAQVISGESDAL